MWPVAVNAAASRLSVIDCRTDSVSVDCALERGRLRACSTRGEGGGVLAAGLPADGAKVTENLKRGGLVDGVVREAELDVLTLDLRTKDVNVPADAKTEGVVRTNGVRVDDSKEVVRVGVERRESSE